MQELNLIKNKKKLIRQILMSIEATKDNEKKYKLYKDILKVDNTEREIVRQYLLLVKQIRKKTDKEDNPVIQIMSYIHHFPPEQFNKDFIGFGKKENSSMETLLLFLNTILSKDWAKATFEERRDAANFFYKAKIGSKLEIKNTSPITWENDELYIFTLYKKFVTLMIKRMEHYEDNIDYNEMKSTKIIECDQFIKKLEDELKAKEHSEIFIIKTHKLIEEEKQKKKIYALIEGNFFKIYLKKFYSYLYVIQDAYLKKLSTIKFTEEDDKHIFEYFMFFISNYNFENITSAIRDVWKYSFINFDIDKKYKIIEQFKQKDSCVDIQIENDNKLIIKSNNIEKIEINNFDDYLLENLLNDIFNYEKFNEVKCIKYVKITKLYNHLYIKQIFDEWIIFNLTIFNSRTIKSLYDTLFKEQNSSLLEPDELNIVLNNVMFYVFDTDFAGLTNREIMKVYEYGNYENLFNIYNKDNTNEDILKVIFLALNLLLNFHEILGHFNIGYQKYSFGEEKAENYHSPKIDKNLSSDYTKKRDDKESGENIEIKIFGKIISDITVKEALFILNLSNYNKYNYKSFKNEFMKCNEEEIYIDETFWDYLYNSLKINPNNLLNCENKRFSFNDLIKKTINNIERFKMKSKHPIGYEMDDDFQQKDYAYLIKIINNLDVPDYNIKFNE